LQNAYFLFNPSVSATFHPKLKGPFIVVVALFKVIIPYGKKETQEIYLRFKQFL